MIERCPLCASPSSRVIFRALRPRAAAATGRHTEDLFGRAGTLARCSSCGLVRQLDPPVAPYEEASDDEYLSEERGIRATFAAILERIERFTTPGTLLDAGCGPGLLLDEARTRGWQTTGVEPSSWSVEQARNRGLEVRQGVIGTVDLEPSSFDAIVAADVIEHVDDPKTFAAALATLLKPGGIAFIATPDVGSVFARTLRRWWWSVIPNHLLLFSRQTLTRLMEEAGLRVVEITTHPKTFSLNYYAGRFGGYLPALGKLLRTATKPFGGTTRLVTPDFRDRIALIAIKE